MKRNFLTLIIVVITCLSIVGCGESKKSQSTETSSSEELNKKNSYIQLYNIEKNLYNLSNNYFTYVGKDNYKAKEDGFSYRRAPSETVGFKETLKKAKKYADKEPKLEIDDTVKEMIITMELLYDKLKETDYYYNKDKGEYKKDGLKKGEVWHKEIVALSDKYVPLYEKFQSYIQKIVSEQTEKKLAEMKSKGYLFSAALLKTITTGQKVHYFLTENKIDKLNASTLNMATFKPLYDDLVAATAELSTQVNDGEVLKAEGTGKNFAITVNVLSKDIVKDLDALIELSKRGKNGMVGTSPVMDFNRDLNALIALYNKDS